MLTPILSDLPFQAGDEVAVLINGLGATPLEEQYVMFRRVKQTLDEKGIRVFHSYVGEYATSMEMAGASISICRLNDELKNYLHQYESELSEERPTLCANPAVDALAGHYDHEAHSLGVPVDWRLELPRQLAIPEADFCMMLGNLLENAFHASQKLPPEQRQVKVLARMLSPAMLGLLVENRYDGVLKRQQGILHSTKHDGMGIGLVSIQTAVSRYGGSMTVETENGLFRVNILLNL